MNLTSKPKLQKANNGLSLMETAPGGKTPPYKQNEKIIYLPKDFLKKNNLISTPITHTETNISVYNNSARQSTMNPNSFRCQPNLLLYNKNFYKQPLIIKNRNNYSDVNNNTTIASQKMAPSVYMNVSTIDRDCSGSNPSVSNSTAVKGAAHIVSKVISFSKDKMEKIQQSKQTDSKSVYSGMVYMRKRSKDRNELKVNEERRKMCKSAKEIQVGQNVKDSENERNVNTEGNGLVVEIEGAKDNGGEGEGVGKEETGDGEQKHKKSKSTRHCCGVFKQRIHLMKEMTIDKEDDHDMNDIKDNVKDNDKDKDKDSNIDSTSTNKDTIHVDNKEETHYKNYNVNNSKLLTLLKQKIERMNELDKQHTNNYTVNKPPNNNTPKTISPISSLGYSKNNTIKDTKSLTTPLNTETYYNQTLSTPNSKSLFNTKYYEEVSPKQIVCGNIISSPNVSKSHISSSLKKNNQTTQYLKNKINIPSHTTQIRDNSYECNYYIHNNISHNTTTHNLKMSNASVNNDNSDTHVVVKNNIKDKLYNLEIGNSDMIYNTVGDDRIQQHNDNEMQSSMGIKDKKYRLIYDYERIAKESKRSFMFNESNPINLETLYDLTVHKKTQSFRDVKERKLISNEDEYAIHKKTNSVRIYQSDKNKNCNSYYGMMNNTQHDSDKANIIHDKIDNCSYAELLSFTNRLSNNKANNVLGDILIKSSLKKNNVSLLSNANALYNSNKS